MFRTVRSPLVLLAVLAAACLSLLGGTQPAAAHAAYRESAPAFAQERSEAPQQIELHFSQQLFRREGANTLELIGPDGPLDLLAPAQIDNDDRRRLFSQLSSPLPPGRYLVRWTNLSADDGDSDEGLYPFYVGRSATAQEQTLDRALAADQLIPYPGDLSDDGPDDPPPPPEPFMERASLAGDGVGVGVVLLVVLGGIAALGLSVTWVRWGRPL